MRLRIRDGARYHRAVHRLFLSSLLALTACAPEAELAIDLHTDLVPGVDFESIRVSLGQRPEARQPGALPGATALLEGTRIIEYQGLAPGEDVVTVELVRAEGEPIVIEVPVAIDGLTAVTARHFVRPQIVAGYRVSCARFGARAWCWGAADHIFPGLPPGEVLPPTELPYPVADLCSSFLGICTLATDGTLRCVERGIGTDSRSFEVSAAHGGHGHVELDCGGAEYGLRVRHRCMRDADGSVSCNGSDLRGQLGDGGGDDESTITDHNEVAGLSGVTRLTSSVGHSCALTEEGQVWCWGFGGNLGDGTDEDRFAPVAALGVTGMERLDTFWGTSCALVPGGAMQCWGANEARQIVDRVEDGPVLRPVAVPRGMGAHDLAVGQHHICVVGAVGQVRCWGKNSSGQLGDGTTEDRAEPVGDAWLFSPAVAIDAGPDHTCRISKEGGGLSVVCWGGNRSGELGRPPSEEPSPTPRRVELPGFTYSQ